MPGDARLDVSLGVRVGLVELRRGESERLENLLAHRDRVGPTGCGCDCSAGLPISRVRSTTGHGTRSRDIGEAAEPSQPQPASPTRWRCASRFSSRSDSHRRHSTSPPRTPRDISSPASPGIGLREGPVSGGSASGRWALVHRGRPVALCRASVRRSVRSRGSSGGGARCRVLPRLLAARAGRRPRRVRPRGVGRRLPVVALDRAGAAPRPRAADQQLAGKRVNPPRC